MTTLNRITLGTVAALLLVPGRAVAQPYVFAAATHYSTVEVYDVATDQVVASIPISALRRGALARWRACLRYL